MEENKEDIKNVILLIVEGWGVYRNYDDNAIYRAETPVFDSLITKFPTTTLKTVLEGDIGDKEKGYYNLGTGQNIHDKKSTEVYLSSLISEKGLKQLKISGSESFTYSNFYFNGKNDKKLEGEERILIPALPIKDYKENFKINTAQITDELIEAIDSEKYNFILTTFNILDSLSVNSSTEEIIDNIIFLDKQLKKILKIALNKRANLIITSTHGNIEKMLDPQTEQKILNTGNPVPFIVVNKEMEGKNIGFGEVMDNDLSLIKPQGSLIDVAPTILKILDIQRPKEMEGIELF